MGSVLSRRGDPNSPPATETNTPDPDEGCLHVRGYEDYNEIVTDDPYESIEDTYELSPMRSGETLCLGVHEGPDTQESAPERPTLYQRLIKLLHSRSSPQEQVREAQSDPEDSGILSGYSAGSFDVHPRIHIPRIHIPDIYNENLDICDPNIDNDDHIEQTNSSTSPSSSRRPRIPVPVKPPSPPSSRKPVHQQVGEAQSSFISHESSLPKRRDPRLLRWMCQDFLQENRIVPEESQMDTSTWRVRMKKDFKRYVGVGVHHKGAVLQAPGSEVTLSIPSGRKVFLMGHIHTDPKPFLHAIPDDECLVAPIVDYTCVYQYYPPSEWFKISVPHCITNEIHLTAVRVRHGNIYKNVKFTRIPADDCFFEVDEHHITIFTRHFSQFICTVCSKVCQGSARAFIFGGLTPLTLPPVHSSLRVYMCSPLYRINDYRQKLVEIEGGLLVKRHRLDESDVTWNPDETQEELCVAVQSNWDPRQPTKTNQEWDQDTRKLVQKMKASGMLDMQRCHICKTDPSEVATFSFTAPPTTNGPQVALMFSGRLEMSIRDHGVLMQSDFDVIPNEICTATQNDDHLRLRRVTKLVICRPEELVDFGLGLGLTHGQVKQKETNNSTSIENAALDVVVEWWDACPERYERKVEFLVNIVDNIGKSKLAARVREMMRKVHNGPEVNNNNNIPCAEEGASQISLPVPEMLPVQSTNQVTQ